MPRDGRVDSPPAMVREGPRALSRHISGLSLALAHFLDDLRVTSLRTSQGDRYRDHVEEQPQLPASSWNVGAPCLEQLSAVEGAALATRPLRRPAVVHVDPLIHLDWPGPILWVNSARLVAVLVH